MIDTAPQTAYISGKEQDVVELYFGNAPRGAVLIKKIDSLSRAPLSDVQFFITDSAGAVLGNANGYYTTDSAGTILIDGLAPGTTIVAKETRSLENYLLDDTPQTVRVKSGETVSLEFRNQPLGNLLIVKRDSVTGKPLQGVTYTVKTSSGTYVDSNGGRTSSNGEYQTDASGQISLTGLLPDTYIVTEKASISGYSLDATPHSIVVRAGDTQTLNLVNHPKGSLVIQKFDSITKEPLANAVFRVTTASGELLADNEGMTSSNGLYTTNAQGQIVLSKLTASTLIVTEVTAPDNYKLDPKSQTVVINDRDTQTLNFYDEPLCVLTLLKRDADTKEPLANATFSVKYSTGEAVGPNNGKYTTGRDGTVTITGIAPNSTIICTEEKAPTGYIADTSPKSIVVHSGADNSLTFDNEPSTTLIIQKYIYGTANEPLAGVGFKVVDGAGAAVGPDDGVYYTDHAGEIVLSGLTPGMTVTAREISTVDGFVLDGAPQDIQIKAGSVQRLTYWNHRAGTLKLLKLDSVSGQPIAGAEFLLTYADGRVVDTEGGKLSSNGIYRTDENGEITVTGITGTIVVKEQKSAPGYTINPNSQTQTVVVRPDDTQTLVFYNDPTQILTLQKYITGTATPIPNTTFLVTSSDGTVLGPNNGEFVTDRNGRITISGLVPGVTVTAREVRAAEGYVLSDLPQSILIREGEAQSMTFFNTPVGGLLITKSDAESGARLSGVRYEVQKKNGEIVGTFTTDRDGVIRLPNLEKGWYIVIEREAKSGYLLDATPQEIEVKDGGTATLVLTNRKTSNILIHKIDANTGKGIYGVTFLLYDSNKNPIGEYVSDQDGYVYMDEGLPDGRYYCRELKAADGYILDDELKTFYVRYGATSEITWKNTAVRGQIQIVKKSADDNPINGLPAGTLLEGAVFEIYDKAGNVVDTITTGRDGRAASKLLPLSRYTVKEVTSPNYYAVNPTVMTAYLEHEGQIISFEVLDESVATGVSIKKTGYSEVMPGGSLRYTITQIANTSTVPLSSFYWRDTLPAQAALNKVVTGTYNQALSYKIVYKTNTSGDTYLTLADNLSTTKNYVLDARPATLGLAANERVTEVMFVFGQVKAGFAEVETAYIYATANSGLSNGSSLVNVADVGGMYKGQWIQGVSRWTTTVYAKTTVTLPKTGY